jgi:RimJ/RimL family protein N-acetyltransferase
MKDVVAVTLEGETVRLEPMAEVHLPALLEAAQDDEIWTYLPVDRPRTASELRTWYDAAIALRDTGLQFPFTILDRTTGRPIGGTRYLSIAVADSSVEIGHSWLAREFWRSSANTESKYLLLRHAFEELGCIRVWFKSDARNLNSHRAIERLGARREGLLRKHMRVKGGFQRDSVIFSIIADEWLDVRARLEQRLARSARISTGEAREAG